MSTQVTIEVDSIQCDGVEWSALRYIHPMIEAAGFKFEMSVAHWGQNSHQGTGFEYKGGKRAAYLTDGNIARLIHNDTGVELPDAILVIEKGKA